MQKLSMLILCLLVVCKSFSQIDIPENSYVILTEDQAKANIKELIAYDALKQISVLQEARINNFKLKEDKYKNIINLKDTIILKKDRIIENLETIIDNKPFFDFNAYAGIQNYNLSFNDLEFYAKASVSHSSWSLGTRFNYNPTIILDMPEFYVNLYIEYKIF